MSRKEGMARYSYVNPCLSRGGFCGTVLQIKDYKSEDMDRYTTIGQRKKSRDNKIKITLHRMQNRDDRLETTEPAKLNYFKTTASEDTLLYIG
jgi:hypothetical protein